MLDPMQSPVDLLAEPLAHDGLGWTTITIMVAALLLLATNAVSLQAWIDDMPPSPAQQQAADLAAEWRAITDQAGLGPPRAWLHDRWKQAEEARF